MRDLDLGPATGSSASSMPSTPAGVPRALLDEVRPDVVINAIGLVKQLEEASRPVRRSPQLAVSAPARGSLRGGGRAADPREHRLRVLGELRPPARYTEDDTPDARDLYGRTKLLGEVTRRAPSRCAPRSSAGSFERACGLLEWFAAQDGRPVRGFTKASSQD